MKKKIHLNHQIRDRERDREVIRGVTCGGNGSFNIPCSVCLVTVGNIYSVTNLFHQAVFNVLSTVASASG